MAKKVVIVESNAKAKTISRYLGKGYSVKACRGHIRDLPPDRFGVDVEQGFEPTYQVMKDSRKIVDQLRKEAEEAEEVYLAPDPDREGEAIAWHLTFALELPAEKVRRVTFNEITRSAVLGAFDHPRQIDLKLVDAQQARRILDRIVGYELSPWISRKVVRGISAGRVQSVALRLIVDRERERDAFVQEEYWQIVALLLRAEGEEPFEAELKKLSGEDVKIPDEQTATDLVTRLQSETFRVSGITSRNTSSKAPAPFRTSTLQQAAGSRLRMTTAQTMRLAQQLYEGVDIGTDTVGLITYMRTDATRVSDQALGEVREFIGAVHGDAYLPKKPNTFRSPRGAQAAHEAVRPTDVKRTPQEMRKHLSDKQFALYELIWRRFVASQMKPARYAVTTVDVSAGDCLLQAKGRKVLFDGHTRVFRPDQDADEQALPDLAEGDELTVQELTPSQHFTQPPPRYTEASLVRELEKQGIGRPSTYAPTIGTLLRRNYVRRLRRALKPTDLGLVVTDHLVANFPRELDVGFTSKLEDELDEVEEGKRDWRSTLAEFYKKFSADMAEARGGAGTVKAHEEETGQVCPECGKPMVVKYSRKGDKFLGCSGFPDCKTSMPIERPEEERGAETDHKCDKCGSPMLRRMGRRGREYLACSGYPDCRNIMGLDREGTPVKLAPRQSTGFSCPRCSSQMHLDEEGEAGELKCGRCRNTVPLLSVFDALAQTEVPDDEPLAECPECGGPMEMKRSRNGLFLGCAKYPDCKSTSPMPKDALPAPQPTHERCEKCGRPLVLRWGQYGRFLACSGFPGCRNLWKVPARGKKCPDDACEGRLIKKMSPEGEEYLGCTRHPECDQTAPVPPPKKKAKEAG